MSNKDVAGPEDTNTKLKIGLIADSPWATKYIYDIAEWGQRQSGLSISHLIVNNNPHQGKIEKAISFLKRNGLHQLVRHVSFELIRELESRLLSMFPRYKDHFKRFDLNKIGFQSITITPIISKSGFVYRYSAEDIQKVRDLHLDVIIRCGAGILRGDILRSSRFGIISFHHADNRINRGGPAGFWEVYLKEANTGFVIQQLTEELDGGNVLVKGSSRTRWFFLLNQAAVFTKSNFYLKKLLSDMGASRALPAAADPQPYFNPLFKRPHLFQQLKYIFQLAAHGASKIADRFIFKRKWRWGVAYIKSDWKSAVMWRGTRLPKPPKHFLADPFVISEGGRDYCFVEDYDRQTSRGCISVYELKEKRSERLGTAIVEPFHLSFPYLFRFDSKIYMSPETSRNKDVRIYECVNFPLEWKLSRIVMSDVAAVDTMIFERDGLWWLFTNIDPVDSGDYGSELLIYYSDNPLSDSWRSHPQNPIPIDPGKARNGGILFDDKWIYRVSQKEGFDVYGEGFAINKIVVLNKNEYQETELCSVEPNFFPNLVGSHHLHSNGNISVFDYK